jgi:uncharacterized protein YcbK (DUF882 family)
MSFPLACAPIRTAMGAAAPSAERRLFLVNTHTGEVLESRYFVDGHYSAEQLGVLDWLLRDHRTGDVFPIETRLLDLLHELAIDADQEPRFEIISGYRSPATNAMLAATTDGVSSSSLHMQGRAIDVRLVGMPAIALRDIALQKQAGGVGYYPAADFVHLDIGRVRSWSG